MTKVNNRGEVREFLASRRGRLTPQQAGLPAYGGNRRVPGLRREEVALLAGVSVDYYTRLERGSLNGVSDSVLEALARALKLDEAERSHLFDLARAVGGAAAGRGARREAATSNRVRPGVQGVLDAITDTPAWIRNGRSDFLASNTLGRALYAPIFEDPVRPANTARFVFFSPHSTSFYRDWAGVANDIVAVLRAEAGHHPYDRGLSDLVGELSTRSEDFRIRWAAHDVRFHRTGSKRLHHPIVGDLDLSYEALEFPADPGLTLIVYTAEPASPTHDALRLLASWAAAAPDGGARPDRAARTAGTAGTTDPA